MYVGRIGFWGVLNPSVHVSMWMLGAPIVMVPWTTLVLV
jgi:hypothetical protein